MSDFDETQGSPTVTLSSARPSRVWTLENGDFSDEGDVSNLIGRLYDYPEDFFYLYGQEGLPIAPALQIAIDSRVILIKEWQHNHYPHPQFQRDYVRLLHGQIFWAWERALVASGPMCIRYELALSAEARRTLEQQQLIAMHKASDSNPIELTPNFCGIGIDLYKAFDWLSNAVGGKPK